MPASMEAVSVSALNRYVKTLLETDEVLSQIWVEGELSSVKIHGQSGHVYFKVIDRTASVKAVMFRSYAQRLRFRPEDGMKVILNCQVSLYERDGDFQLYVRDIIPRGAGDRQTELDRIKEKLEKEGLFSRERKRPIPYHPSTIVVVSSSSGAAIHDIESVAERRDPYAKLILVPVNVQGALAVEAIKNAVSYINREIDADVCIITRGGGSKDDLWLFNDESLVRAAATLKMPFISAVGHEIDTTLLDLVADVRAATPSSAAEIALRDIREDLALAVQRLNVAAESICRRITLSKELLDDMGRELLTEIGMSVNDRKRQLNHLAELIDASSPLTTLRKGYGHLSKDGESVGTVNDIAVGDVLKIRMYDGTATAKITEVTNE